MPAERNAPDPTGLVGFSLRIPRLASWMAGIGLAGSLFYLDHWLLSRPLPIPALYLLPVLLLAWFAGWRPAALLAGLISLLSFGLILSRPSVSPAPVAYLLGRALTLTVIFFIARLTAILRLMLLFHAYGGQWRVLLKPLRVGERIVIVATSRPQPPGQTAAAGAGDILVLMDPGRSFGTGTHPTTQMCLRLLERSMQPDDRVLDLGSGSGILSIAAAKLGAQSVLALDIDPEAERATRNNIALNQLQGSIEFRAGSLDSLRQDGSWPDRSTKGPAPEQPRNADHPEFDIVLANILTGVLLDALQNGLADTLAPGGWLILSGIRREEMAMLAPALQRAGLVITEQLELDGWLGLAAQPRAN